VDPIPRFILVEAAFFDSGASIMELVQEEDVKRNAQII
jgi:hypothetical protein